MPWHVMRSEECPASKPWAVMKDEPHEVVACHESEDAANQHLAALYASEPEARAVKYDHINFKPPSGVRSEAQRGLDWRREHGRGGTGVGIARARDLSNGVTISPDTGRRMKAFFDRHQSDRTGKGWSPGEKGFPSNGRIAHALWGGDAGYAWSRKLVRQMNSADERSQEMQVETRSLCASDDDSFPLLRIERRSCEERVDGPEQSWLVGYAARFGTNSLKMDDFYERIAPEAFGIVNERRGRKSPLETRALFNHDPNHVLGRYPSTLRMKVDERGLRYEIKMPETRRDLIESIERGDIRGSSFSFVIAPGGEEWSVEEGRSIRTVKSIASLIDVGPVTFPAYPDASVAVARRSYGEFVRGQRRASPDAVDTGDFVSWGSGEGRARGKITKVVRDGEINVPDSSFTITGTEDDPAALIRVYRELAEGWSATDVLVGHKFSTLTKIDSLKKRFYAHSCGHRAGIEKFLRERGR